MNFRLGAALEKRISLRVMGTLSGLRWPGGVPPGRSHVAGTAENPAWLPPGRSPGGVPSRALRDSGRRAEAGRAPSAHPRRADLEDSFAYPCPAPAQCCLVALGSAGSLHSWGWSSCTSQRLGKLDLIGGGKIQAHPAPPVKPSGRRFVVCRLLSVDTAHPLRQVLHSSLAEPQCGCTCVLGIGRANEEGSEGPGAVGADHSWQRARGPCILQLLRSAWQFFDFDRGRLETCWSKVVSGNFSFSLF